MDLEQRWLGIVGDSENVNVAIFLAALMPGIVCFYFSTSRRHRVASIHDGPSRRYPEMGHVVEGVGWPIGLSDLGDVLGIGSSLHINVYRDIYDEPN